MKTLLKNKIRNLFSANTLYNCMSLHDYRFKSFKTGTRSVHTSANLIFDFFKPKRKKEMLLILIIFTYFKVQNKKAKKENGQENRSFFHFFNFDVKFKNTKNTVNGKKLFCYFFIFLLLLEK